MGSIKTIVNCGLVIDVDERSIGKQRERKAHFIPRRYRIDDAGHICLTQSLPLIEPQGSISVQTAALESLLDKQADDSWKRLELRDGDWFHPKVAP